MTQYYTIKSMDFTSNPLTYTETIETIQDWFILEAEYGGSSAEEAYNVKQAIQSIVPPPEEDAASGYVPTDLKRIQSYALMVSFAVAKALGREHVPHFQRYKEGLLLLVNLSS
jgi:hypothetical protein